MKSFLYFLLLISLIACMVLPSFSSEQEEGYVDSKILQDISFETIRLSFSLEELSATWKKQVVYDFLQDFLQKRDDIRDRIIFNGSTPKQDLFLFLLFESEQQKQLLKLQPKLISAWIDSKIQVKDSFSFKKDVSSWNKMQYLDPEAVFLFMPHLFLSLGDQEIIESVFATEGFDPYFKTDQGDNLFHSFLLLRWVKKHSGDIVTDSHQTALQLLIDKSPPELLTQKNKDLLSPIALSIFLNDFVSYNLFMKQLSPMDFFKEMPYLEKAILNSENYHFLQPIYQYLITNKINIPVLRVGEESIFLEHGIGFKRQASFLSLEKEHSISVFDFNFLFSKSNLQFSYEDFTKFQEYEEGRVQKITEVFTDPTQKELKGLYTALFKRDIQALQEAYQKVQANTLYSNFNLIEVILEESIRNQFEKGVLFSIFNTKNTEAFYDSIFLSFLSYASLNQQHPRKEIAKKIIKHVVKIKKYRGGEGLSIAPIYWSIEFGLPEELEFFLKELDLPLNPEWIVHHMDMAFQKDYRIIFHILNRELTKYSKECQNIFLQ